jgi:hypothetical protein
VSTSWKSSPRWRARRRSRARTDAPMSFGASVTRAPPGTGA